MDKLTGELKVINLIEGSLVPTELPVITGALSALNNTLTGSLVSTNLPQLNGELIPLEIPHFSGELTIPKEVPTPSYQGEYTITPEPFTNKVLETNGFTLTDDVTVLKIPYYQTSNESGYTVYIGGE